MLEKQRFDHFPRSIVEIRRDLQNHSDKALQIAPNLLIHYPAAHVFFVNKQAEQLHRDIANGLEMALKDGSFDKLFNANFSEVVDSFSQQKNTIVELSNPYLMEGLPQPESAHWVKFPAARTIVATPAALAENVY